MNFFTAYGQQFILTSGSLYIGCSVSSLVMKARHKAFASCNKKFRKNASPFLPFCSIFSLGDGLFTLNFVLNVLVYFPSFLFFD